MASVFCLLKIIKSSILDLSTSYISVNFVLCMLRLSYEMCVCICVDDYQS